MKIVHWTMFNHSGMNRVAESLALAEKRAGIDSMLCNPQEQENEVIWERAHDADIHVTHTHFPDWFQRRCKKAYKQVYVVHGTPEHIFTSAFSEGKDGAHGHSDPWMLFQYWMQHADVTVTFWPRHEWIIRSLCDKRTRVEQVTLGVDKAFWCPGDSRGRFIGSPSLLTSENCHQIKWPLDLFMLWPYVSRRVEGSPCLHAFYLPTDQHRWFFPLVNRNGCSYSSHLVRGCLDHNGVRNALRSVDYYIGLVRYGDFNRMSLEAAATGCPLISYRGNPYADYWLTEGDQRVIADELTAILNKQVAPREKTPVPDISVTYEQMLAIYNSL